MAMRFDLHQRSAFWTSSRLRIWPGNTGTSDLATAFPATKSFWRLMRFNKTGGASSNFKRRVLRPARSKSRAA